MFRRSLAATLVLTAGALTLAATTPLTTQDPAMEMPNEHHARVLRGVGKWQGTITPFMPGMPSEPMAATETTEAIGGFWTRSRFECNFLGMPYVGTGVLGYSAADQKYVGTWCDSMSSYLNVMEGEYDAERDLVVVRWTAPTMDGSMAPHRQEIAMTEDSYTSTFFVGDGDGSKSMVIEMKRVGKAKTDK